MPTFIHPFTPDTGVVCSDLRAESVTFLAWIANSEVIYQVDVWHVWAFIIKEMLVGSFNRTRMTVLFVLSGKWQEQWTMSHQLSPRSRWAAVFRLVSRQQAIILARVDKSRIVLHRITASVSPSLQHARLVSATRLWVLLRSDTTKTAKAKLANSAGHRLGGCWIPGGLSGVIWFVFASSSCLSAVERHMAGPWQA